MKKVLCFAFTAAFVFGAALSCSKEEQAIDNNENQKPEVADPAVDPETSWTFTALAESPVSKMGGMDASGEFAWENGDEIKIIWDGGSTTAAATVAAGRTSFEPAGLPASGTAVWAVYPSNMNASLSAGNLVIDMPAVQKNALAGYFVAKAAVGDEAVLFKHPVSYYKLVVDGDGTDVTRLELTSAGSENLTASSLALSFDGSGIPSVAGVTGEAAEIDYEFTGAGTYYIPVVPGVAPAADDLTFQFYRTENAAPVKAGAYKHGAAIDNERAHIKNWGSLPAKATNRYVSATGSSSNDGVTSSTPWDIATFKAFMENSSSRTADVLALYDGVNFHFAAGTYTPSAKIAPNISIRTNLIGEDAATTIFDGNSVLLFDIWKQTGETVTFKNFTIQNATNSSDGGAIRVGNSDRVFNIKFENCVFSGNTATGKSGGVICVTGANSSVSFKDCAFNSNVGGSCGGVLHAVTSAVVSFDNCTFTGNSAVAGGVLDIQGTTGVTCNDCIFTTNSATKYGGSGTHKDVGAGAIIIRTSGDAITLNRCTFDRNSATGFGGAIASINTNIVVRATGCLFTGNNGGSGWGSAIHLSNVNGQRLYLDNCLFKGNTTTSRGVIAINNATCLAYMNNVTFKDNTNSGSGAWGVAYHASGSILCMNNVTTNGNHSTNASPGNSVVFNTSDYLITNCTFVDTPATGTVRDKSTYKSVLCNNIIINESTPNNCFVWQNSAMFSDSGKNVLSCDGTYNNAEPVASDKLSVTSLTAGAYSEVWNSTNKYGVYTWTNDLTSFTAATQSEVETAIKSYDIDYSANVAGVTHVGNDFWAWLESIGATGNDARGVARAGKDWPGAYQQN